MSPAAATVSAIKGVGSFIGGFFERRGQRKNAERMAKAAIDKQRLELKAQAERGDQQAEAQANAWDKIGKKAEKDTWKDEYATILVTSPMVVMLLGAIFDPLIAALALLFGHAGEPYSLLAAGREMVDVFHYAMSPSGEPADLMGVPVTYGTVVIVTIFAALSLKIFR